MCNKVLVLVLTLTLALTISVVALSEGIDISNLNHDELVELYNQVARKLFSKSLIDGVEIPGGKYIVGRDIPAGTYVVDQLEEIESGKYLMVSAISSEGEEVERIVFWGGRSLGSGKITIEDGMTLSISTTLGGMDCKVKLTTFASLFGN